MIEKRVLHGSRTVLTAADPGFPESLRTISKPPKRLYCVGDVSALREGLAVVGARKATPYGIGCARRFSKLAAERGIAIISGGARGCDTAAHEAALEAHAATVVFLGGGCDRVYPVQNLGLFQKVIDQGGVVVSEQDWDFQPQPWCFRERNRLIAGLAKATLIVEAGLPSGTFSTADEAIAANREVLVVPGAITSAHSRGANRLIYQGATPIVDDETFQDVLFSVFGELKQEGLGTCCREPGDKLVDAVAAEPLSADELVDIARSMCPCDADVVAWLTRRLSELERSDIIMRRLDGRYMAKVDCGRRPS